MGDSLATERNVSSLTESTAILAEQGAVAKVNPRVRVGPTKVYI